MRDYTREELLALTPAKYLADGFFDAKGELRPELKSDFATAAASQLLAAEASPQELTYTYEAFKQLLAAEPEPSPTAFFKVLPDAIATVGRVIGQPNNRGIVAWIIECAEKIGSTADVKAFMEHFLAVLRLYVIFAGSQPPAPPE